jgi:hypothetical protein
MAYYTFENQETGETFTLSLSFAEHDEYLVKNPTHKQLITTAPIQVCPVRIGRQKPDSQWREYLRRVKKANPGSTINDF